MFCAFFTGVSSYFSFAQESEASNTELGVSWTPSLSPQAISEQLHEYEDLGFTTLELAHPIPLFILDTLSSYSFKVFIRSDNKFLTTSSLSSNTDDLKNEFTEIIQLYSGYEFIKAIGLYSYSQSFNQEFVSEFSSVLNTVDITTNLLFYEVSTVPSPLSLDFSITEVNSSIIPAGTSYRFLSKNYDSGDFEIVQELIETSELLFFESGWLNTALADYEPFGLALAQRKNENTFLLPLPQQKNEAPSFNWAVFIFILIWFSVGIHVRIVPTYKELITRYFIAHRFFVEDVMRYRERSSISGIFLFFQHAAFFGLVVYIVSATYISELGIEAFYNSVPQLGIVGQNYFSLFVLGFLIACFVQIVGLLWLYLPSKSLTHFSQALNLYTWIFHLDFIFVSIMLILILTGSTSIWIFVFGIVVILSWLIGFLLTSVDSSKYLLKDRTSYILYTFGLHSLVNIGLLVLILTSQTVLDFLELIISI